MWVSKHWFPVGIFTLFKFHSIVTLGITFSPRSRVTLGITLHLNTTLRYSLVESSYVRMNTDMLPIRFNTSTFLAFFTQLTVASAVG